MGFAFNNTFELSYENKGIPSFTSQNDKKATLFTTCSEFFQLASLFM